MGEVVGDLLPLAFGVAISPVPIIAVILLVVMGAVLLGKGVGGL